MKLWQQMALEYSSIGLSASEITERIYAELGLDVPYNTVRSFIWRHKKKEQPKIEEKKTSSYSEPGTRTP